LFHSGALSASCFKTFYVFIIFAYTQIKKNGSAVTEMMYRLNISQRDEKQKLNKAFLQLVSDKKQELKQQQEALLLKTIDDISKRENVMQMKVTTFFIFYFVTCTIIYYLCLQCFDAVGWAAGRASGL